MFDNELLFAGYYYVGGKMLVPDWSTKQQRSYSGNGFTLAQDSFVILAFLNHGDGWADETRINGKTIFSTTDLKGLDQYNAPCMLFLPKGTTIGSRRSGYGGTALVYKAVEYN